MKKMKKTSELPPDKLLERILRVAALLTVSTDKEPETVNTVPPLTIEQPIPPAASDDVKNHKPPF